MATDIRTLQRRRGTFKGQITRICNLVSENDSLGVEALKIKKIKLEEAYNAFCSVQLQIEDLQDDDENENLRIEVEDLYFRSVEIIERNINSANTTVTSEQNTSSTAAVATVNVSQSLLPKINIKQFDGNYAKWNSFYDTFLTMVHENDTVPITHKFHLLKSYLVSEASTVINALNASEENYKAAWELLISRYNKPRKIIQSHIKELFQLSPASRDSPATIRILAERAEMHVNALRCLKQPVEWDEMLIYIVSTKLDKYTRNAWERSLDQGFNPTFKDLTIFLHKQSQDAEPVALLSDTSNEKLPKKAQTINKYKKLPIAHREKINTFVAARSWSRCVLCKQGHALRFCPSFLKLSVSERETVVKHNNLCLNCLKGRHKAVLCYAPPCQKCKNKHNEILHCNPKIDSVEKISQHLRAINDN